MFFNVFIFILNAKWLNITLYVAISVLILLDVYGFCLKKESLFKLAIVSSILLLLFYFGYYFLLKSGWLQKISSFDDIKTLINDYGGWGIAIYTLLNVLQVALIPIPSTITILVGTAIYGPTIAFLFASLGILIGSVIAFLIGRYCSKPVINWIFGKEKVSKYEKILNKRTGLILFLAFILPFFPDDLICMLAGITDISLIRFILISLFSRSIGVATIAYLGSGKIIPFSGWGIVIWIILAIIVITAIIIAYLKREKIKCMFFKK